MAATPIFDIPERNYIDYAHRQQAYEAEQAAGLVSPDGRLEIGASRAAGEVSVTQVRSMESSLFGTDQLTSISIFQGLAGWSSFPYLGSQEKLTADEETLRGYPATPEDKEGQEKLLQMVGTWQHFEGMRREATAQLGALLPS